MDNFTLSGLVLVLLSAVAVSGQAYPRFQHVYLNYVSPYQFLQDAGSSLHKGARLRRSPMYYGYSPMSHQMMHNPMPYGFSFGYNPMFYPYKMFSFPMHFPYLSGFDPMGFQPRSTYPSRTPKSTDAVKDGKIQAVPYSSNYNFGYRPPASHPSGLNYLFNSAKPTVPSPSSFGGDFMKMMGFGYNSFNKAPATDTGYEPSNAAGPAQPNFGRFGFDNVFNSLPSAGGFNFDKMDHAQPGPGKNYQMSYSKSSSMSMDWADGKGKMVTQDSSYKNDNGKVEKYVSPKHYYDLDMNGMPMAGDGQGH